MTPPKLPGVFHHPEAFERREFPCPHCGAVTVCDGKKDCHWEIKTDKCICGNGILIRVCEYSYGTYVVTRQKDGTFIGIGKK